MLFESQSNMKITEALLAEHVVFHNLFDYIERTLPRLRTLPEVRSLAGLLESLLEAHSLAEDRLIIEPLEHCLEQLGQNDTFHQEHDEIENHVRLAQTVRHLKSSREHLLKAVLASRKHFDKEERIVFPLAEKLLKGRTLASLGKSWIQHRNAAVVA